MINQCRRWILNIFSRAKKSISLNLKHVVIFCVLSFVLSTMYTTFNYIIKTHNMSMEISLNYDGAQHGLTPSSGRFDITKIKSNDVLQKAVKMVNDKSLTVENVKPRITIEAKMPKSALDKTVASVSNGGDYSYTPAEFVVYYSQKKKFGKNYTEEFLNALSESYVEFFKETYSDKNTMLQIDLDTDYKENDYDEIAQILTDDVNSMIQYIGNKQEESANFISTETGYTFSELIVALTNIRDISIAKFNAYVLQNKVSKDKDLFLRKKAYLIDREKKNYDHLNDASTIANDALKIYDPRISGVAFVPTIDLENEYYMSRTKTGLDNLTKLAYKNGKSAVEKKKVIDAYQQKLENFSDAPESSADMHKTADSMISGIKSELSHIADIAVRTDNEYNAKKNNDYVAVKVHSKPRFSLVSLVKYFVLFFIVFVALYQVGVYLKKLFIHTTDDGGAEI